MPYLFSDLSSLLPDEIICTDLEEETPNDYNDPATACVVIGQEDFDEDELLRCVKEARPTPAFLPQEALLDLALFGYDWWNEQIHELNQLLEYHRGLQYVHSLQQPGFHWPSVEVSESIEPGTSLEGFREETPLHQAGYMIRGAGGRKIPRPVRWAILSNLLETKRISLQDVAETIANHVRLRKLQADGEEVYRYAIQEWEHDLARLRTLFYDRREYTFLWPSTEP